MAQFDVFSVRETGSLLIDLQSDLVDHLSNRIVAPLVPLEEYGKPFDGVTPLLAVDSHQYVMLTQFMAAVPLGELRTKVANLEHEQYRIKKAIDRLFHGFDIRLPSRPTQPFGLEHG